MGSFLPVNNTTVLTHGIHARGMYGNNLVGSLPSAVGLLTLLQTL